MTKQWVFKLVRAIGIPELIHPLRSPITWACQRGVLPSGVRRFLPWRWALEPFTIYGSGFECKWIPTEFDSVGHWIFWRGLRQLEPETAPVILDHIRQSRCVIDIGANTGIYTVLGCKLNPNTRFYAVEPVPKVFASLSRNVSINGFDSRVTVLNVAIGASEGTVPFHQAEDCTMGSFALEGYRGQRGSIIEVTCRTLDSLVAELGIQPDFLKIDVEGFSHLVLLGATEVLRQFKPRIVLEANPGDPCEEITEVLLANGYGFQNITKAGPITKSKIAAHDEFRNWLCVPVLS